MQPKTTDVGFEADFDTLSEPNWPFLYSRRRNVMLNGVDYKDVSNVKISARLRQVVLLIVVILIGILISMSTEAGVQRATNATKKNIEVSKPGKF